MFFLRRPPCHETSFGRHLMMCNQEAHIYLHDKLTPGAGAGKQTILMLEKAFIFFKFRIFRLRVNFWYKYNIYIVCHSYVTQKMSHDMSPKNRYRRPKGTNLGRGVHINAYLCVFSIFECIFVKQVLTRRLATSTNS